MSSSSHYLDLECKQYVNRRVWYRFEYQVSCESSVGSWSYYLHSTEAEAVEMERVIGRFTRVPPNGLVLYCGTCLNEDGKEKKMSYAFEPFRPINTSLYLCDNKFHTEALQELLQDDSTFGFVVMDGSGCLFGTVSGSSRNVLHRFLVDLPKKHGRGGQSALRFARLRLEKRHNYVRKCCELCVQFFIENEHVNVAGIVLAGSAELKDELYISDMLDPRIKNAVVKVVDVSYGGDNGFNQAIELSADTLANVKFVQEKKLISGYFDELARDTGKFCYGVNDTLKVGMRRGIENSAWSWVQWKH